MKNRHGKGDGNKFSDERRRKVSNLKEALMAHISEDRLVEMTSDMVRIESYYGIPNQETGVASYIKDIFDVTAFRVI